MRYLQRKREGFTLVELMIVVAIIGILAVLAIYGVRKYLANAKTAEARNSIGQMAKDASTAYQKEGMAPAVLAMGASTATVHALCKSSSKSVPAAVASIKGVKYQPTNGTGNDYEVDITTNLGFSCIKFSMDQPQYFAYSYNGDGDQNTSVEGTLFTAIAYGDLNGDSTTSQFTLAGTVTSTHTTTIAPNIGEISPEE